jgi:hypothetical protein
MDKLYTALEGLNKTDYKYDASSFFTASYDSPIRLINRHNEVREATELAARYARPCFLFET